MQAEYFLGLDLGQAADFTALAILEGVLATSQGESRYQLRFLHRYPLGTGYPEIVTAVTRLAGTPPLAGQTTVIVDQTGVGRALVDMLRQTLEGVVPVTITGGHSVTEKEDGSRHVPKKELVTCLQLLLQSRRLKICRVLPETDRLVRELENFRVKITAAANETFAAGNQGVHDDLVMALALASWFAETQPRWGDDPYRAGGESLLAQLPKDIYDPEDSPVATLLENMKW